MSEEALSVEGKSSPCILFHFSSYSSRVSRASHKGRMSSSRSRAVRCETLLLNEGAHHFAKCLHAVQAFREAPSAIGSFTRTDVPFPLD
jgi:hypothetical protein